MENILDLFGGVDFNSRILAKILMELDPLYVSVIIKRWEKMTRRKAIKINKNIFRFYGGENGVNLFVASSYAIARYIRLIVLCKERKR